MAALTTAELNFMVTRLLIDREVSKGQGKSPTTLPNPKKKKTSTLHLCSFAFGYAVNQSFSYALRRYLRMRNISLRKKEGNKIIFRLSGRQIPASLLSKLQLRILRLILTKPPCFLFPTKFTT